MIDRLKKLVDRLEKICDKEDNNIILYSLELYKCLVQNDYFNPTDEFLEVKDEVDECIIKSMDEFADRLDICDEDISCVLGLFDELYDSQEIYDILYLIDQELEEPQWTSYGEVKDENEVVEALKSIDWDKIKERSEKVLKQLEKDLNGGVYKAFVTTSGEYILLNRENNKIISANIPFSYRFETSVPEYGTK